MVLVQLAESGEGDQVFNSIQFFISFHTEQYNFYTVYHFIYVINKYTVGLIVFNYIIHDCLFPNMQSWAKYQKFRPVFGSRYFFPPTFGSK